MSKNHRNNKKNINKKVSLSKDETIGDNSVENFWIRNVLPKQVSTLPYDKLTREEQIIIDKILANETISDNELVQIKKLTAEYGEALKKYNADETIKANEEFKTQIVNENELLNLVFETKKPQKLTMNLPFAEGKQVTWTISPMDDSRAVKMTEKHMDLYKDLTPEEVKVQQKGLRGDKLSKAEEDVIEHINQKLQSAQMEDQIKNINEFLAYQIEPPTIDDIDKKVKFWEAFPFTTKMSLYLKVQDMLGLSEQFDDKLFLDE